MAMHYRQHHQSQKQLNVYKNSLSHNHDRNCPHGTCDEDEEDLEEDDNEEEDEEQKMNE